MGSWKKYRKISYKMRKSDRDLLWRPKHRKETDGLHQVVCGAADGIPNIGGLFGAE
jgi:hypothetical protein